MSVPNFEIFSTADFNKFEVKQLRLEHTTSDITDTETGQLFYKSNHTENSISGRPYVKTQQGNKAIALIDDVNTKADQYIPISQKGQTNGVATLDSSGKIPVSQLHSYLDDVVEYPSFNSFPSTGESGKIYISTNDNKQYRWSGTQYIQVGGGAVASDSTPQDVSTSASIGTSGAFARGDHRHKLGDSIVQSRNIASNAVNNNHIQNNSINGNKLQTYSVTSTQLANNSVTSLKITNYNVDNSKLAYMSGRTVKANLNSSSSPAQDVSIAQFSNELANYGHNQATIKAFLNPTLNSSGGQVTWTINNALNSNKKRNGYFTPIIQVWALNLNNSGSNFVYHMSYEVTSNGSVKIYMNLPTGTVPAGSMQAVIME